MRKVTISIENGESFELLVDGDITKLLIETTIGDYEIIKKVSKKKKITRKDLNCIFSDETSDKPNSKKKRVGVKAEMERYSGMAKIDDILEHYK